MRPFGVAHQREAVDVVRLQVSDEQAPEKRLAAKVQAERRAVHHEAQVDEDRGEDDEPRRRAGGEELRRRHHRSAGEDEKRHQHRHERRDAARHHRHAGDDAERRHPGQHRERRPGAGYEFVFSRVVRGCRP